MSWNVPLLWNASVGSHGIPCNGLQRSYICLAHLCIIQNQALGAKLGLCDDIFTLQFCLYSKWVGMCHYFGMRPLIHMGYRATGSRGPIYALRIFVSSQTMHWERSWVCVMTYLLSTHLLTKWVSWGDSWLWNASVDSHEIPCNRLQRSYICLAHLCIIQNHALGAKLGLCDDIFTLQFCLHSKWVGMCHYFGTRPLIHLG